MKRRTFFIFSACTWIAIGALLLYKGISHTKSCLDLIYNPSPLLRGLHLLAKNREEAVLFLIVIALFIGLLKGRMILSKTALRISQKALSQAEPLALKTMYPKYYYILIPSMMLLGMVMRLLPFDIQALADIAIGSALIHATRTYFQHAKACT